MQGKLILQDEAVFFKASTKHMGFLQGYNVPLDKKVWYLTELLEICIFWRNDFLLFLYNT